MPVTITFHKLSEKKPQHGQSIIWLQTTMSFGYQGFTPREVEVEYQWMEYLSESKSGRKLATGHAICYDESADPPESDCREVYYEIGILAGDCELTPDDLWIDVEEYWRCFDGIVDT